MLFQQGSATTEQTLGHMWLQEEVRGRDALLEPSNEKFSLEQAQNYPFFWACSSTLEKGNSGQDQEQNHRHQHSQWHQHPLTPSSPS